MFLFKTTLRCFCIKFIGAASRSSVGDRVWNAVRFWFLPRFCMSDERVRMRTLSLRLRRRTLSFVTGTLSFNATKTQSQKAVCFLWVWRLHLKPQCRQKLGKFESRGPCWTDEHEGPTYSYKFRKTWCQIIRRRDKLNEIGRQAMQGSWGDSSSTSLDTSPSEAWVPETATATTTRNRVHNEIWKKWARWNYSLTPFLWYCYVLKPIQPSEWRAKKGIVQVSA